MNRICLTREQLLNIIQTIIYDKNVGDEEILAICHSLLNYEIEIHSFHYFLSKIIDRIQKNNSFDSDFYNKVLEFGNQQLIYFEEFTSDFVEFMLRNDVQIDLSLEDKLNVIQGRLLDYNYDSLIYN